MPYQQTSRAAYETAQLATRQQQVYDALKAAGDDGLSNLELSANLAIPINVICGATNALVQKGLVVNSGRKRESVFRKLNIIWRVTTRADEKAKSEKPGDRQLALL